MATHRMATPRSSWAGKVLWLYLPALLLIAGAALAARELTQRDGDSGVVAIDSQYPERRDADIAFFEGRVTETNDSLSYNRLTSLYLQRFRDTGDVADLGRAERSATKSLEVARGAYTGLVNLGLVRVSQHRFEDAAALAGQALALDPDEPAAHAILGDTLMARGEYAQASLTYQKLLEMAPGAAAFARQAALAELRGNVDVALQFWEAAIAADAGEVPENAAWARVQRGNLLFGTGELKRARSSYEDALESFPGYAAAQAGLGRVAAADGDFAEAAEWLTRATATTPLPEYVITLGEVRGRAGDSAAANRQFALVRAIADLFEANGVTDDLTLIAFAADHGEVTETVVAAAAEAYERRPGADAASTYAWVLHRASRQAEALPLAKQSLAQGTQDPLMLFRAGAIAHAAGDDELARRWLSRAAELNRAFSPLHAPELARLLEELGGAK